MEGREPGEPQAVFTVARYLGLDLLQSLFGQDELDSPESILERFDVETGRSVSRTGRETWEVRFRLKHELLVENDALYLIGDQDEYEHYNLGLRIVFRGD